MKWLGVFLLPLDEMLVHRRVTPSINVACTHLYSWVERGTGRVKCLVSQEHNTMFRVMARTRTARSGDQGTTTAPQSPQSWLYITLSPFKTMSRTQSRYVLSVANEQRWIICPFGWSVNCIRNFVFLLTHINCRCLHFLIWYQRHMTQQIGNYNAWNNSI